MDMPLTKSQIMDDVEKEHMLPSEWQTTTKSNRKPYRRTCYVVTSALLITMAGFVLLYHGFATPKTMTTTTRTTKLAGEVNGLVPECKSVGSVQETRWLTTHCSLPPTTGLGQQLALWPRRRHSRPATGRNRPIDEAMEGIDAS